MFFRYLCAAPRFTPLWKSLRSTLVSPSCFARRGIKLIRKNLMEPPLGELKTMKIYDDRFKSIITPEMKILEDLFVKNGYEIRIAGGAVRDFLMGNHPHDFDFATTATPEQMKNMFAAENIRLVNLGGEKHGTITARINDKENFEVTTLRIDRVTDGRHAEVIFTTDWQIDANRRDLTVNAMFLSFDGVVYDYFKGIEHLKERRVLFVGDAALRIQEDYLRILRYFRFYGRLAIDENSHDAKILEAIRLNAHGLEGISGERLMVELRKILEGNFHCSLICLMYELGVTPYIGLPTTPNIAEFQRVCRLSKNLKPNGITRLAALLSSEEEVLQLHSRLRLSNQDKNQLLFIVRYREEIPKSATDEDFHSCQTLQFAFNLKGVTSSDVRRWTEETLKYHGNEVLLQKFMEWETPRFPVTGFKLMEHGVKKGPQVGRVMHRLRQLWFESGFSLDEAQLLSKVREVLREISPKRKS